MHPILQLFEKDPPERVFWRGTVHSTPSDLSDRIDVIVPEFDEETVWRGLVWQSRDSTSMPVPGDRCLVVLDNLGEPWVIAWWPFD
jgi:hypothetical protein